jgi:hypothetical protein
MEEEKGPMKTLQIAGGVFAGIMAVLLVINIPRWVNESRTEHKQDVIRAMSPEKLIAGCGQPLSDKEEDLANSHSVYIRSIKYKGSFGPVLVEFMKSSDTPWSLRHIEAGSEIKITDNDGPGRMILNLPCMDK